MQDEQVGVPLMSVGRVDDVDRHVGKKLRMRRIMLGLSQQVLGDAVGVSIQQIQKYEKATNRVASGKLYQFANLLKVQIEYFFEGIDGFTKKIKSNLAESQEAFVDGNDAVQEKEVLLLVRSYNEITDSGVRKKILDLVRTLSVH